MNEATAVESERDRLPSRVGKLSALIGATHYPTTDRAALKRWAPGQSIPLAFYRLWLRHCPDDPLPESQWPLWMLIAWSLAYSGEQAHRPDKPLGQALAEAGLHEARLERLLSASADLRPGLLAACIRLLASKGMGFDHTQALYWLLTSDHEKRDALNRRIATDYYRHLPKTDKE